MARLAPPFGRDALWPLRLDHAAGHAPPGEARGRPFGDFGEHVDEAQGQQAEEEAAEACAYPARARGESRQRRISSFAPALGDGFAGERAGAQRFRSTGSLGGRSGALGGARSSGWAKAVWAGRSGSVESAARIIRSTPKPRSTMVRSYPARSATGGEGSRAGALKPAWISAQDPSVR